MDTKIEANITHPAKEVPDEAWARILFGKSISSIVRDMQTQSDHPLMRDNAGEEYA